MNGKTWTTLLLTVALTLYSAIAAVAAPAGQFTNSIGIEFVLIPSGSFMMGSDPSFDDEHMDESPLHKVTISKAFYLGKYEVTQAQWIAVMGSNPSRFKGRNNPVERVSWYDVQEFIKRLNALEGHERYRLPTEAEWEYAARAGTSTTYFFGDDVKELSNYAWYHENAGEGPRPVGQKQPNAWGLHDIYGNVREWVQDWYGAVYYANSPEVDPDGPLVGSKRVDRGGSWGFNAMFCRSAFRGDVLPDSRLGYLGFRLGLSLE